MLDPLFVSENIAQRGCRLSEHYSEFRQIDTAFLPWGWISVAIHPVGPKRKLRSPLFCANIKFASSREILSTTDLLRTSKVRRRPGLEIDRRVTIVWLRSCVEAINAEGRRSRARSCTTARRSRTVKLALTALLVYS